MRKIKLQVIGLLLILTGFAQSQLSINVHVGTPPAWGPMGYNDVRYYYLPDVQAYYDVQTSMFIYISGSKWIHRTYLPSCYHNYDLYNGYKVVMRDYRGNTPYYHFREHRVKYAKGYRNGYQKTNGERHDKNYQKGNVRILNKPVIRINETDSRKKGNNASSNKNGHDKDNHHKSKK